jgi:hypothetical protein
MRRSASVNVSVPIPSAVALGAFLYSLRPFDFAQHYVAIPPAAQCVPAFLLSDGGARIRGMTAAKSSAAFEIRAADRAFGA